jgi:hypothetical protein
MNAEFNPLDPRFWNLSLELGNGFAFLQSTSTSRTAGGQRYLHNLLNLIGNGAMTAASVLGSGFPSGSLRLGFGFLPREGSGLALAGSQRFFQHLPQAFYFCFQCLILTPQPRDLFGNVFLCHTPTYLLFATTQLHSLRQHHSAKQIRAALLVDQPALRSSPEWRF